MNTLNIVKRIARECGEDSAEITTIQGTLEDWIQRILDYVNEGYKIVWNEAFKNQETDITGTWTISESPYDISEKGITKILTLQIADYKPLIPVDYKELLQTRYDTQSGQPEEFAVFGKKIYFDKTPDQSYSITYSAKASFTSLDEDTDIPLIDENILINYGRFKYLDYQRDFDLSQKAEKDYLTCKLNFIDSTYMQNNTLPAILPEDAFY